MKKTKMLIVLLAAVFLAGTSAFAQISVQNIKWTPGEYIKVVPMYCPTEGSYTPRQVGAANDTSASYVMPESWNELWLITKPWQDTSGDDSVDVPIYVQYRLQNQVVTGTRYMGWITADSSNVTTADTLGGDVKNITSKVPQCASAIRVYWDGVTGNEAEVGNRVRSWLVFVRNRD